MSYGLAATLQEAVYGRLSSDPGLAGTAILDAAPAGPPPALYVSLGEEDMRRRGDSAGALAEHRFVVSIFASEASFATAKTVAAAVETALTTVPLNVAGGRLVLLTLDRVRARRSRGQARRRIEMRFRAVLDEI